MASVKYELRNEGKGLHEWDYVPLSEPRVVRAQIENRAQVGKIASEPVSVTYVDLDRLIDTAPLTDDEKKVIGLLMIGYTKADICETTGITMDALFSLYNAVIVKLVEQNEYEWHRSMAHFH